MPSHSLITDPHIHEPKGISVAGEGEIYIADGNGSGQWTQWPLGKAFYQHGGTGQVITTTPSKLLIDGLGTLTRVNRLPREIRGSGNLWDTTNNRITPVREGDGYLIRVDMPVTAESGAGTTFKVQMEVGSGLTPSIVMYETYFTTGKVTPYTISMTTTFDILTAEAMNNGIELFCNTGTGTVTLGSPGIYIAKISDGNF